MKRQLGVCFDVTGTLIELAEPVGEVYHRFALQHEVDLPAWRLGDAFERVVSRSGAPEATGEDRASRRQAEIEGWFDLIRQVFQATDSTARFPDFPAFARALFEYYGTADAWKIRGPRGVLESTLQGLRRDGHRLGLVSNFDHRLHEVIQVIGLESFFEEIVIPSEAGAAKPDRRIFEMAANRLGCGLDDLVYVGDDAPERMRPIEAHGLKTISVVGAGESAPDWEQLRRQIGVIATVQQT